MPVHGLFVPYRGTSSQPTLLESPSAPCLLGRADRRPHRPASRGARVGASTRTRLPPSQQCVACARSQHDFPTVELPHSALPASFPNARAAAQRALPLILPGSPVLCTLHFILPGSRFPAHQFSATFLFILPGSRFPAHQFSATFILPGSRLVRKASRSDPARSPRRPRPNPTCGPGSQAACPVPQPHRRPSRSRLR